MRIFNYAALSFIASIVRNIELAVFWSFVLTISGECIRTDAFENAHISNERSVCVEICCGLNTRSCSLSFSLSLSLVSSRFRVSAYNTGVNSMKQPRASYLDARRDAGGEDCTQKSSPDVALSLRGRRRSNSVVKYPSLSSHSPLLSSPFSPISLDDARRVWSWNSALM
jgi:hypothetical protein